VSEDVPVVGGIVLAAGGGSRFGATKQLAELRGRPLLSYAVESMLSVPAIWPVVVVLGHDAPAVVTLGDQPFITPQVIAGSLDFDEHYHDAVRTTYGGAPGHPVVLTRRLLERVGDLRGDVGFRDLLVGQRVRRFEAGQLCDPTDVDTQEELARL
jgi:molybdenum cofactor cytidylyltransferase